jgi:tyrosyl-tRNA synthetase
MTYSPRSDFLHVMQSRGFLADCTDLQSLDEALLSGVQSAYIGFDATAKSLHVGSLIQIMMLRWFQKTGHRPITLMGGGTTKVGDPSFRADERPLLGPDQIEDNIAGIKQVFSAYIDYGDDAAMMINNAEWLDGLNYLDFLRDIGRHFSINRMLSFESVKSRLDREQSLSFLEFNYMILQAYDFMELHRRYGCILQMGGSDQWGNIVNGIDLTRRVIEGEVYGLTSPLLTTSDGKKMGKSQSGAVWLNPDMLSPYEFWQFWRNTTDDDVGRFLKLYTELPLDECDRLGALQGSEINEAKAKLATEVTTLLHGADAAAAAADTAREVFEKGGVGDDLPTLTLSAADIGGGISIVQLIVKSGLAGSGKEAKRLIAEGGARMNDDAVTDAGLMIDANALAQPMKLRTARAARRPGSSPPRPSLSIVSLMAWACFDGSANRASIAATTLGTLKSLPMTSGTTRLSVTWLIRLPVSVVTIRLMIARLSQCRSKALTIGVPDAASSNATVPDVASATSAARKAARFSARAASRSVSRGSSTRGATGQLCTCSCTRSATAWPAGSTTRIAGRVAASCPSVSPKTGPMRAISPRRDPGKTRTNGSASSSPCLARKAATCASVACGTVATG